MADRTWTGRIVLKGEKKGVSSAFGGATKGVDGLAKKMKQIGALGVAAGATALFVGTAQKVREFEKSISDLSAITGATGDDLLKLERASKRIGQTTTLSASQAAEAFKLMASAKPDLLANLDALEATTLASVTLAEAAGLELPTATAALGESLNQFGAGADQATRFINVLAAGAQKGSSEIRDTSLALKNAGVTAKLAGLSFEEANAGIQVFAKAGITGSKAGEKFKSVLVRLQAQANDQFNPSVVGMNAALDNLATANLSVTEKIKIFGIEQMASADILVQNRDLFDELEVSLTGTNLAYEQANARTDNLDGSIKRLNSAFEAIQLSFSSGADSMRVVVDAAADIFNALAALNSEDEGGISITSGLMEGFALSLKTVFTAGVVLKNMFDTVLDVLGFVAKSIVRLLERDFAGVKLEFAQLKTDLASEFEDVGEFAARTFNPEMASELETNMEAFFKEPIVQVAEETVAAVALVGATAGQEEADRLAAKAKELADKEAADFAAHLETLRERHRTEREVLTEESAITLGELDLLLANKKITEDEWRQKTLDSQEDFNRRMDDLDKRRAMDSENWAKLSGKQKLMFGAQVAGQLASNFSGQSKKMFKLQKAAALAQAAVALPAAVIDSFRNAGGYPWGIIPAGLMLATGLSEINAIKSASFGGGGGGGGGRGGGGGGGIPSPPSAGGGPVSPSGDLGGVPLDVGTGFGGATTGGPQVNIQISGLDEGGLMSTDQVRALMASISEQLGDGVDIDTGG